MTSSVVTKKPQHRNQTRFATILTDFLPHVKLATMVDEDPGKVDLVRIPR